PSEPQQHPNNRWQQNQDRAASATTNAPAASSRQFHDSPQLAILREPRFRRPAPSGTPYSAAWPVVSRRAFASTVARRPPGSPPWMSSAGWLGAAATVSDRRANSQLCGGRQDHRQPPQLRITPTQPPTMTGGRHLYLGIAEGRPPQWSERLSRSQRPEIDHRHP